MSLFFNKRKKHTPNGFLPKQREFSDAYKALREDYITLCTKGTWYPNERALIDFDDLAAYHRIQCLAINLEKKCLYIATTRVVLAKTNLRYNVGHFIVTLNREENFFRYENVDGALIVMRSIQPATVLDNLMEPPVTEVDQIDIKMNTFHHPHIGGSGVICMSEGEVQIKDAITRGDLRTGGLMATDALFQVDAHPYRPVTGWPLYEGEI